VTSYKYEVVRADGATFSIHKERAAADYWAARIGGRVIEYTPRTEPES
jgi:hypothetical protein